MSVDNTTTSPERRKVLRLAGAAALAAPALILGRQAWSAPGKHFFTILLAKNGIDPDKDITWRQYPADLLGVAVDKGEIHAIADGDPNLFLLEKRNKEAYVELATILSAEYARKVCCVVGVSGQLVRNEKPVAAALARALVQATDYVHENPNEAAKVFAKYARLSVKVPAPGRNDAGAWCWRSTIRRSIAGPSGFHPCWKRRRPSTAC